jgi:RNA polymerase sigma factor (sigma-70 family)
MKLQSEEQWIQAGYDPVLRPILTAADDGEWDAALEALVQSARKVAQRVLTRFLHERSVSIADVDDVLSGVTLRLVRTMQTIRGAGDQKAIEQFEAYVAGLTFHTVYDYLRRRYPEGTRLKNQLRYILTHDERFVMWRGPAGLVTGRRKWEGRAVSDRTVTRADATPAMLDRRDPAGALDAIFGAVGEPVPFEAFVRLVAKLWDVADMRAEEATSAIFDPRPDPLARLESRRYLERLWSEIAALPPRQRAALLLNLRDGDGNNATALFIFTGIATVEQIAEAIGVSIERLAEVWNGLPLDDATIAGELALTRQQVINLRSAARERLGRRMNR